ncbi:uncharacterized protein LOC127277882 isoform X2 [Leptopilina boulardi]|uniref:uncharacterized protein LOC127277882 isoform X2 n=1 Tax=Leptopilina boulardi TaxID=63433 RepID=UPI0021F5F86F|nr:uncharacterized protein LOC127277882 isoform X2 [Leptopilina boulardi]
MFPSGIWIIFALTIIFGGLNAVSVVKHHHDDEYLLEHRVIYQDAISKAKNLTLYPGTIPGCKACTSQEMMYCKDGSVIADHCCCDFSYNGFSSLDIGDERIMYNSVKTSSGVTTSTPSFFNTQQYII